jgi:ribose/xylose/arabinose/galactoside ABC-type transport system permease subunit
VVLGILRPAFFEPGNLRDLLVNSSYTLVVACGMTVVILSGNIDISVGSQLAVCSFLSALAAKAGWPLPGVLLAGVGIGALLGALNGVLVTWGRIPSILVTLGTMTLLRGALLWLTGGMWLRDLPPSFTWIGRGSFLGIANPIWVAGGVALVFAVLLSRTRWGRAVYAVGGQARAAELAGVPVPRTTLSAFVVLGALTGLASLIYSARFTVVQSNVGAGLEMLVITAVVVGGTDIFGGRGSLFGTVLGVVLFAVLGTALTFLGVPAYWEGTLQGAMILVAVLSDALATRGAVRRGMARA